MKFNITIYGAGYVGLVTAACLAELGHQLLLVDINPQRIAQLKAGECPIHEPLLPELLRKQVEAGRLNFTQSTVEGVKFGYLQFIAVGTPSLEDGAVNLSAVYAIANDIGRHLDHDAIIINKSTSPVGTSTRIYQIIQDQLKQGEQKLDFEVISNPEFLKQGEAVKDFMQPDRVIVGLDLDSAKAAKIKQHLTALYAGLTDSDGMLFMDRASAELSKYAANAFLAMKISFINEMSRLAELFHADIEKIRIGVGLDKRIGLQFLKAGCGYGGSCFPKDVKGLIKSAQLEGYHPELLQAVDQVNNAQKVIIFNKLKKYFKGSLENKTVALWGLAFKPNTDDMREAPSCVLMEALWQHQVKVQAYDPAASKTVQRLYPDQPLLTLAANKEQALENADVLVIVTDWPEFKASDYTIIKQLLNNPVIFDGRNLFNPKELQAAGLAYYGIGFGEYL